MAGQGSDRESEERTGRGSSEPAYHVLKYCRRRMGQTEDAKKSGFVVRRDWGGGI